MDNSVAKKRNYSWMWQADGQVNACRLDLDLGRLRWYDTVGCGCGIDDLATDQTVEMFRTEGIPAHIVTPPDDVLAELDEALTVE